ncbi:unnamed protein product [Pocillopora meandrina]|uniref:Uncharacterized protein n=1 Tax=Pocillopora meandrina TaxID=46732 RepID=A0AAU9VQ23_9CNID|nr:unnamed protein product [Pocillopora meandrina]
MFLTTSFATSFPHLKCSSSRNLQTGMIMLISLVCRRPYLPFIWISWRQDQPVFSGKENRCLNHVAPFGKELNCDQRPPHCLTIAS